MSYSWTRFGFGVALGTIAWALLFVATSYFVLSVLLLLIANVLMVQGPSASTGQPSAVSSSDLEEWRQFGRDTVKGLRGAIVPVLGLVLVLLVWDLAVRRYSFLAHIVEDYSELLAITLMAAMWPVQVVAAYRNGRHRRLSSSD